MVLFHSNSVCFRHYGCFMCGAKKVLEAEQSRPAGLETTS